MGSKPSAGGTKQFACTTLYKISLRETSALLRPREIAAVPNVALFLAILAAIVLNLMTH